MSATLRGEAAVRAKLAVITAKMTAAEPLAENTAAAAVARAMAAYAPIATGELRTSVGVSGSSAVAAAPHAIFVQAGTSRMSAQPFATEAARAAQTEVVAAVAAVMKAAIRTGV